MKKDSTGSFYTNGNGNHVANGGGSAHGRGKGFSFWTATAFIVGEVAGGLYSAFQWISSFEVCSFAPFLLQVAFSRFLMPQLRLAGQVWRWSPTAQPWPPSQALCLPSLGSFSRNVFLNTGTVSLASLSLPLDFTLLDRGWGRQWQFSAVFSCSLFLTILLVRLFQYWWTSLELEQAQCSSCCPLGWFRPLPRTLSTCRSVSGYQLWRRSYWCPFSLDHLLISGQLPTPQW